MLLLRNLSQAVVISCVVFSSILSAADEVDESRACLFTKSYYSMTEKDHVLYDVLHKEKLLFSNLDLYSIGDRNGQYPEEFEKAYSYYLSLTNGKRVSTSAYYYYTKKVADYLYELIFNPVVKTDSAGTASATATEDFSGTYATMLIGIDYEGTNNQLSNCIHDVEHVMEKLLIPKMGVKQSDVLLITDHQKGDLYPTGNNIRKQLKKFASRLNYTRSGYFHYSGHGTYMTDDDGDEADHKDEALCPVDCNTNGMLRDDELFESFICILNHDVKLVMTTDCCHSGTIMDLPYKWNVDGSYEMQQKISSSKLDALADVVMISGCLDSQTSADGGFMKNEQKGSGAMTAAYIETLRFYDFSLTYRQLITKMHELLKYHGHAQRPVLSSTRKINLDAPFMSSRAALRP